MQNDRHPRSSARERVQCALAHQTPERVPFSWGFGPTPEMTAVFRDFLSERGTSLDALFWETEDVLNVTPDYIGPDLPKNNDIWGVKVKRVAYRGGSYEEFEYHPLAGVDSISTIEDYQWPDPDWFDFKSLPARIRKVDPAGEKAHKLGLQCCGNVLERYTWMTGQEEMMINLLLKPDVVQAALRKITDFFKEMMRRAISTCSAIEKDFFDILYFADDLGGQTGLLQSREVYRDVVQPFHRELISYGKSLAPKAKAMHHSDGSVFDILPDLMDAGVDILEAVQVDAAKMEPERLKSTYGSDLSFHGGISVQSLLPHSDTQTVIDECTRLVNVFGENGGYIAAPSHAVQVGTPTENILTMLQAVLGEDDYNAALQKASVKRAH